MSLQTLSHAPTLTSLPVCRVDDVPEGEGRAVTVDQRRIAIFRAAAGWFALEDACPHDGGPLSDGILSDSSVICPLHERRFDLTSGAPLGHECESAVALRITVDRDGLVRLELAA
jgi:nitrite reductase (NADH) small subunit